MGPYTVDGRADGVFWLLLWQLVQALVPLFCLAFYCPSGPAKCPRGTLAEDMTQARALEAVAGDTTQPTPTIPYLRQLVAVVSSPGLVVLCVFGGSQAGVSSAWSGMLQQMLPEFSSEFVGWCGFASSLASVAGNVIAGIVGDVFFPLHQKHLLIATYLLSALFYGLFTLSLPSPFSENGVIPRSAVSMVIVPSIAGFFQSACDPLLYELAAEMSYPIPEGTSAGFITLLFNAATLAMLFIAPAISLNYFNSIMCATMLAGGIATVFVPVVLRRRMHEQSATRALNSHTQINSSS